MKDDLGYFQYSFCRFVPGMTGKFAFRVGKGARFVCYLLCGKWEIKVHKIWPLIAPNSFRPTMYHYCDTTVIMVNR